MNLQEKIAALAQFPLFADVARKDLADIAASLEIQTIPKQTTFIKEGHIGEEIYCILSGLVRIYNLHESGKELTVTMRLPGEIIGEMALLNSEPRSANAQTIEETRLFVLRRENFVTMLERYPKVSLSYLKILSERLRETIQAQKTLSFASLEERTYRTLKQLSTHFMQKGITLTHEQLSVLVNATQPRVTEVLNLLQKSNKVQLARKKILVS